MSGAVLNSTSVVSVTVEIAAPQAFVWDVLVDYERYPEWNPYTVRVDTTLELGSPIVLHLPDPNRPGELMTTTEHLRVVEAPHHLQYDTGDSLPGIFAVRDQWVEQLPGERSSYRTTDVFAGEHAQLAYDMQGDWVRTGFDSVAHALKARAESLWGARS